MITLYIDTSSSFLYSAILKNNEIIDFINQNYKRDMSIYSLNEIKKMFKKNNLNPDDVDRIIVCNGPGSFTGIRIGVTIAKTFAWSLKKNITTISSLEAMALSSKINSYKVPIIDARRGYVFAAIFDENNNIVMEEQYIKLDTLKIALEPISNNYQFITNDNILVDSITYKPDFVNIIKYCENRQNLNPHAVNPIYLKKTEAEEVNKIEC